MNEGQEARQALLPGWRASGSIRQAQHFICGDGLALCGRQFVEPDPTEHFTDADPFPHIRYCGTCLAIRTRLLGGYVRPADVSTRKWLGVPARQRAEGEDGYAAVCPE